MIFLGGVAAGAAAIATYPKWKDKVNPLISGALAGVAAAYKDASAAANEAAEDTYYETPDSSRSGQDAASATVPFSA
jgi:hypothetical protein